MYANIIFIQGSETSKYFDLLNEYGEERLIEELSEADYGEYYEVDEIPSYGKYDSIYISGSYILSYNYSLSYIGLEKKLN